MREIDSAANPLVKRFRRALADGATGEGWIAVEGPLLVEEAIREAERGGAAPAVRCTIRSVLVARGAQRKFSRLVDRLPETADVAVTPDFLFQRTAATESPQGIAALVEIVLPPLKRVFDVEDAILIVAYGVRDPGNLGTMLRSAEALGADAVVTTENTVHPFNPKAVRASGGALFRMPVYARLNAAELLSELHRSQARVLAAARNGIQSVAEVDLRGRLAFLIGNEASGLPPEARADVSVAIPIRSGVDSVNAAMAAGILLYEAARQRGFKYQR